MAQIKNGIILFYCLFASLSSYAQQKNEIVYELPPKVDSALYTYVTQNNPGDNYISCAIIRYLEERNYRINIYWISKNEDKSSGDAKIVFNTNRYIVLNKKLYIPVLIAEFDDMLVGQEYGTNEKGLSYYKSGTKIYDTYSITFNLANEISHIEGVK
jgi:hypothetical protein